MAVDLLLVLVLMPLAAIVVAVLFNRRSKKKARGFDVLTKPRDEQPPLQ